MTSHASLRSDAAATLPCAEWAASRMRKGRAWEAGSRALIRGGLVLKRPRGRCPAPSPPSLGKGSRVVHDHGGVKSRTPASGCRWIAKESLVHCGSREPPPPPGGRAKCLRAVLALLNGILPPPTNGGPGVSSSKEEPCSAGLEQGGAPPVQPPPASSHTSRQLAARPHGRSLQQLASEKYSLRTWRAHPTIMANSRLC